MKKRSYLEVRFCHKFGAFFDNWDARDKSPPNADYEKEWGFRG
jgi:hypothetical protein